MSHTPPSLSGPAPPPPLSDEQLKAATEAQWKLYAVINDWIRLADTKAAALLAACGALTLAAINVLNTPGGSLGALRGAKPLAVLAGVLLLAAAGCALAAITPRLLPRHPDRSSLFFGHIVLTGSADEYETQVRENAGAADVAFAQICRQVWANAHVAAQKHQCLFLGSLLLAGALAVVLLGGVTVALGWAR
jgi:hypothetical protein